MSKVIYDISMSLDGFITAAGQTAAEPLGVGGDQLHEWAFGGSDTDRSFLNDGAAGCGAVISGRKNYDDAVPFWGPDGPMQRTPVFVLTHEAPASSPEGGVYTFVTDGPEEALAQARRAAGDKDVYVMGGAQTGAAFLEAGLLDEIGIHLVPVLLGSGTPLFDSLGHHVRLESLDAVQTPSATHLRYRVAG
ncbi:dihydrofolate reductase family protein [Georgenia halophila]|uniref:Dihydrofolate reductase family protein n=1 Tax=Georgenia halophila TaxID=620889 RepID=A0ABP8LC68_9MICO